MDGEMVETLEGPTGGDVNETFDNMDYESEESKELGKEFENKFKDRIERAKKVKKETTEDEKEPDAKKEKKEEKDKPKAKKGSDLDTLEDDEDVKDTEKDEKKISKEEKDKDEKDDEKDDSELSEEEKSAKAEAKKLKIRMSDGLYGIESDAKVRVKIDGDFQEVPVQELINNYSGKTAWDKKFSEIGNEKKVLETEKAEVTKTKTFLQETLNEVIGYIKDEDKNPMDALMFLVEKSGQDSYSVYRKTLESNLEEVEKLMSMSEVERKAYFLEKKDEFRTKSEEARQARLTQEQTFNQALQKVDQLRQAHGVSEEQYLQALDELEESEGEEAVSKMSDEQVVDYASLKPHVTDVQDVLEPYEDSLDDSKYSEVVRNLARQLRAKDFTKEQLTEWASKEFMDEDIKDLQSRTKEVQKKSSKAEVKSPEKLETLDFDDDY